MPSLFLAVHRANQKASAILEERLIDVGLTLPQYLVIEAVSQVGSAIQITLVGLTGIDRSTLADIVRRLEGAGWISRRRSEEDGRAMMVKLTDLAESRLPAVRAAVALAEDDLLREMPGVEGISLPLAEIVALDATRAAARRAAE